MKSDVFARRRGSLLFFLTVMALLAFGSIVVTQFNVTRGLLSFVKAFSWGVANFYPDAGSFRKFPEILAKLFDTVLVSVASTVVAAVFAMFLAIAGSRTTRAHPVFTIISRGIGSFFRNMPLVAWAMILMLAFSQSPVTGFLALALGSFGFLTRAFMETIDEVGANAVEALQATGAAYPHIVFQAVVPSSLPQITSWILFMIETNIRDATLVGFLTGTGIGFLFDVYYKSFNYHATSLVVLVTVVVVILTETLSNYVRRVIL